MSNITGFRSADFRGATMMTKEEATAICQQMADESGITDVGLAANAVIRDLIQLSHSNNPLIQADAIEILVALDPEGWIQGTQSDYRAQQQNEGKENV